MLLAFWKRAFSMIWRSTSISAWNSSLMGCTTHAEPESNKLTEAELQELQELFAPGSWYAQACTSYYEAAEAVDLGRLFYDGIGYAGLVYGQCYVTDRERDWCWSRNLRQRITAFSAPRAAMDDILRQYFDISLDDTRKMGLDNLLYWEEADAWVRRPHGYGPEYGDADRR